MDIDNWKAVPDEELIRNAHSSGAEGRQALIITLLKHREALVRSNRQMTVLTWVIAICTVLLLVAAGFQIYLTWQAL